MSKPIVSDACIGCGTCESICPAVFKVEEADGKIIAQVQTADYEAQKELIDQAVGSCPVQAISWEE